ncbi:hypothetical protein ACX0G9_00510 [Flavitalea flava]
MSEKDYQNLMDLAAELQKKTPTKEEALRSFIRAGILDKDGNFTEHYPHLAAWQKENNLNHD